MMLEPGCGDKPTGLIGKTISLLNIALDIDVTLRCMIGGIEVKS